MAGCLIPSIAYRLKQNIPNRDLAHGVVVQKMINAEKTGILFTANLVNGRRVSRGVITSKSTTFTSAVDAFYAVPETAL